MQRIQEGELTQWPLRGEQLGGAFDDRLQFREGEVGWKRLAASRPDGLGEMTSVGSGLQG